VYLPLHRTHPVTVTGQTLAFGFRAASGDAADDLDLARVADLDLMQACQHAAVLAGCSLPAQVSALRLAAAGHITRGLAAVQTAWADRSRPGRGTAQMIDMPLDLPGTPTLDDACERAAITTRTAQALPGASVPPADGELLAGMAVERALVIALISARYLGRCQWDGVLSSTGLMAAAAWDCFPSISWEHAAMTAPAPAPERTDHARDGAGDRQVH
jgi:hypothetical protein